jgi:acyl-homoserine lactone acylase PvdQ
VIKPSFPPLTAEKRQTEPPDGVVRNRWRRTANQSAFNERFEAELGATYRQVFDLADWDRGGATSAPGQSGQPGSPYYDNLIAPWEKGEYFPLAFSRKKVEEVAAHRLLLLPGQFGSGSRQEPAPH